MSESGAVPIRRLILIPAAVTLAVTLLRLAGELFEWSPVLFATAAGGGGAVVGIVWLVPIFGVVFAVRLVKLGQGPAGAARAFGFPILGLVLVVAAVVAAQGLGLSFSGQVVGIGVTAVAATLLAMRGWPALGRTLVAYGLAARIPVALVMFAAILGDWGTHYDAPAPGAPAMSPLPKFVMIGLIPQLTIWIAFTVVVGALFGAAAALVAKRLSSRG